MKKEHKRSPLGAEKWAAWVMRNRAQRVGTDYLLYTLKAN